MCLNSIRVCVCLTGCPSKRETLKTKTHNSALQVREESHIIELMSDTGFVPHEKIVMSILLCFLLITHTYTY